MTIQSIHFENITCHRNTVVNVVFHNHLKMSPSSGPYKLYMEAEIESPHCHNVLL